MFNWLRNLFTKNATEILLFYVNFNEKHYKQYGKENSCTAYIHPILKNDKLVQDCLNNLIDYIRDNYNMENM